MDHAHEWTDRELDALAKRMRREYTAAAKEARAKLESAMRDFDRERIAREKAMDGTPEARKAHKEWLQSQAANQERMGMLVAEFAASAAAANKKAMEMANGILPMVYCENMAFAAYEIDRGIGLYTCFDMVNEDAVRVMMGLGSDGQVLHEVLDQGPAGRMQSVTKRPDVDRDIRWNRQKFNSAMTQGILAGDSIPNMARRVADIYGSNYAAANRAARTAATAAENLGRLGAMERAERLGIKMKKTWHATLDAHTRSSHRALDGETVPYKEPFDSEHGAIDCPGDPAADPAETYNCRCRVEAAPEKLDFDGEERWAKLPDGMTYEEWKEAPPARRGYAYEKVGGEWKAVKMERDAISAQKGTRRW